MKLIKMLTPPIKASIIVVSVAAATLLFADTVVTEVSDNPGYYELDSYVAEQKLAAETTHQTDYPSALVGNPIFWLDCADTEDWTVDANGNVTKLTSRVGTRFMTSTRETGVVDGMDFTPVAPVLVPGELNGMPVLDFGKKGSRRSLLFDKVVQDGCTPTNVLYNIASVIAVWYSEIGDSSYGGMDGLGVGNWGEGGYYGGALLGGGYGTKGDHPADRSQYLLYRGTSSFRQLNATDANRPRWYDNPMVNVAHTHYAITAGQIRHNGQMTSPKYAGFAADWEVVSLLPNLTYGTMNATGIGMNDSRIADVSGGFKVAEMLIFDHALTEDETKLVEAYLNVKWFGRSERGFNGDAQIGRIRSIRNKSGNPVGSQLAAEVSSGERLTVNKLQGGRGFDAALTKTGEGVLALADAREYAGDIRLEAGTLEIDRRAVPSSLPHTAYIHFDPSDAASFKTNALGQFVCISNLVATSGYKVNSLYGRPDVYVPEVLRDELGSGKHLLDFGDWLYETYDHMLYFTTNETESVSQVKATPEGFCTAFFVIGAQRGGGSFVKTTTNTGFFCRRSSIPCRFDVGLLTNYTLDGVAGDTYDTIYVNGVPAKSDQGFEGPGYQVVAIRAGGSISCEGLVGSPWGSGGSRIGEVVLYTRPLTDEELRDGSAYLMKKWLGKVAPGYADDFTGRTSADFAEVSLSGSGKIDVKTGNRVRIRTLSVESGELETLPDAELSFVKTDATSVRLNGGTVSRVREPDVSSSEVATEPILHLDAADASTMRIVEVDGERRVQEWYSKSDRTVLATANFRMSDNSGSYAYDKYTPYLSETVTLNGRPVIDLGPFNGSTTAPEPYKGISRSFALSKSFDNVRHAFIVWATRDDTRGNFFGCSKSAMPTNGEFYDFLRYSDAYTNNAALLAGNGTSQALLDGKIYTNGVSVASTILPKPGSFMLAEFVPTAAVHVSSIGNDRDIYRFSGGIYVAEVILYDRQLTAREQTATRNYLGQKWFGTEPAPLPPDENGAWTVGRLDVAAETQANLGDLSVERVVGSSVVSLTGDHDVSVLDTTGFTGSLDVRQGKLRLSGAYPESVGELVKTENILFHADATWGVQTLTNENGQVFVTNWLSRAGNGMAAVPFFDAHANPAYKGDARYYPLFTAAEELNGKPVVDLGKSGNMRAMRFVKDGVTNLIEHIGSVFWVIDTQNGGGYLLGGGHQSGNWDGGVFNWMRGGAGGRGELPEYPILNTAWCCPPIIQKGQWRLDGASVDPLTTGFGGSWELVSMTMSSSSSDWKSANADGFGFDGRTIQDMDFATLDYSSYMGCQRLAEVIIYDCRLTEEECAKVEAYLRVKWRFRGTLPITTNDVSVAVADGATLDLDGKSAYLKSLSGAGVVENGLLRLGEMVADFANVGALGNLPQLDGSVAVKLTEGQKILVRNFDPAQDALVPILVCDEFLGSEFLRKAVFVTEDGALPDGTVAKLKYDATTGLLYADIHKKRGTMLLIR